VAARAKDAEPEPGEGSRPVVLPKGTRGCAAGGAALSPTGRAGRSAGRGVPWGWWSLCGPCRHATGVRVQCTPWAGYCDACVWVASPWLKPVPVPAPVPVPMPAPALVTGPVPVPRG